jgi:phosphate:Na+ symporter
MGGTEIAGVLLGSVALLLWGVRMVRTGMTRTFGVALRRVFSVYVRDRTTAFGIGLLVTTILQSSTATALLLASFASRALIALPIALAAMLGADIGTAVAAQIFTLNIKWLWPVLIAAGVVCFMASEADRVRGFGRITIGLGLMLLALTHMGLAAGPLQQSATFRSVLSGLVGEPLLGFAAAVLVTWLAHSSLAIVLVVMSLASTGSLSLPLAFALVLGANVGGAIAPFAALSGATASARRVALGNLLIRTALALPALFLIPPAVAWISRITGEPGHMVVNFHMVFNIAIALIAFPFVSWIAKLAERILPEPPQSEDLSKPRHLDTNVTDSPSEALACAMRETLNLADRVADMLRLALVVFEKSDGKLVKEVEKRDDAVDALHEAIKLYLIKVSKSELTEEESRRYVEILTFTTNLEHIGDIIDKNLMELAAKKIRQRYAFSPEGMADLQKFHAHVMEDMRLAFNVFATRDIVLARRLFAGKTAMRAAEASAMDSHYARLREARPESIETSAIHLDVIRDLKRIHGHLTSVAYPILEATGELIDTRLRSAAAE